MSKKFVQRIVLAKTKDYKRDRDNIIKDIMFKDYGITDYSISKSKNGKPYFDNLNVFFSISNDRDYILIVFDTEEVGADIQFFNPINEDFKKLIFRENLSDRDAIIDFSKREAVIKLLGKRMEDLNNIDIDDYRVVTFANKLYTINIAKYKNIE